eukprot:CAMPEP_0115313998 /NCGR_PEP_ID=MMETSP0270-20121206/76786_1 /TAXON_ID=71861 /ORGANISM="Scrippsiella trochoidea, Strain CCMP3099" /LENGTH=173 /DNA_ID=CAMNT_0002733171 /DNA_START=113 /DNA_END=634 /DNA_ORIENTATION=+
MMGSNMLAACDKICWAILVQDLLAEASQLRNFNSLASSGSSAAAPVQSNSTPAGPSECPKGQRKEREEQKTEDDIFLQGLPRKALRAHAQELCTSCIRVRLRNQQVGHRVRACLRLDLLCRHSEQENAMLNGLFEHLERETEETNLRDELHVEVRHDGDIAFGDEVDRFLGAH